jgi:predicted lipoprotein with Yx(FWY)xxD motif
MRKARPLGSILLVFLSLVLAACGSQPAASSTPTPTPTPKPVVEAREVGALGKILVAASNGMTVYTFTNDKAGDGKSACKGGCLTRWPPLTVPEGQKPTGGPGVTAAELATITREDNSAKQVTYKGLPLYFFMNDMAPGDTKGIYPNWQVVKP